MDGMGSSGLGFDASFVIVKKFYTLQGGRESTNFPQKYFFARKKKGGEKILPQVQSSAEQYTPTFQPGVAFSPHPPPALAPPRTECPLTPR